MMHLGSKQRSELYHRVLAHSRMEVFTLLSIALTEEPYRGPIVSWGPADPYMKAEYASRSPQEKEDKYLIVRTE